MNKKTLKYLLYISLLLLCVSCAADQPETEQEKPPDHSGQQPEYEEGVYSVQEGEFDDHGWKPMVTLIVENGKITKAYYDEINEEDQLKSFDQDYLERWKENSGENLLTAGPKLAEALIEQQDPDGIDDISGATSTCEKFKDLVATVLEESPQSDEGNGYYDGLFKAEGQYDERGWKAFVAVVVRDGNITNAYYDEVNKDTGKFKSYNDEYLTNWKENSGTNMKEARPILVQNLIDQQNPEEVDTVSGATSTSDKFKELMQKALVLIND